MRSLRVAIDARIVPGTSGGIEQFVIGLAHGLSLLEDGDEEFLFFAWADEQDWLRPYVGGRARICDAGRRPVSRGKERLKRAVPLTERIWHELPPLRRATVVAPSDGRMEAAGAEVVHFPKQSAFITQLPSIYHPHDLQHLHLPEYFTRRERRLREMGYTAYAQQAAVVAVASSWTRRDVVEQLGVPEERVVVVPLAPAVAAYPEPSPGDLAHARSQLGLPERFIFYPAQTWPHKNHLGLLEALRLTRDETGVVIPLVCSGAITSHFTAIEGMTEELGLSDSVRFCGFVSPLDLQALYRLSTATVIPTKFEAASFPLWEAFANGSPVACSNVTSLPEQAGDAALLFDPDSPRQIAEAVQRLWSDAELRARLIERGRANVARFSWKRTALHFRAHYRRLGRRTLTDSDIALLDAPPAL